MITRQQRPGLFETHHLHADLKRRSVRGGVVTLTSQGAQFAIQTTSTIALAHLLLPSDFGLVAMVTAITGLGQAFSDLGLSEATIQHPEITHDQVSTLFWVNVGIGLFLAAVTFALGPVLAAFYHQPRLRAITYVVSLTFVISGLRVQHSALLQRSMRYTAMAIRDVTAYLVAVALAITLALRGAGYWAIVVLPLALNGTGMILSWVMVRWIPGLPKRGTGVRSMLTFGGNVAASFLTMTVTRSTDNIFIGWYWGAAPLGLYSRAMNLLFLPVRQLGGPARSVAVPTFSRLQDDPEAMARYYLRLANVIVWITAPIFGLLFVAATPVIVLLLGEKWRAASPVFQILALFALGQLLYESVTWLLISCGQSKRLLHLVLMICPIAIISYAAGLPFGIRGVALSGTLAMIAMFPWILKFSFRGTTLTLRRLGSQIFWPILTSLAGVTTGEVTIHRLSNLSTIEQLVIVALAYIAGCGLLLFMVPVRKELNTLVQILKKAGIALPKPLTNTEN